MLHLRSNDKPQHVKDLMTRAPVAKVQSNTCLTDANCRLSSGVTMETRNSEEAEVPMMKSADSNGVMTNS